MDPQAPTSPFAHGLAAGLDDALPGVQVKGVRALLVVTAVETALSLYHLALEPLLLQRLTLASAGVGAYDAGVGLVWLMVSAAGLWCSLLFARGRQGTDAQAAARVAVWALGLGFAVDLGVQVLRLLPLLGSVLDQPALYLLQVVPVMVGDIALFVAFTKTRALPNFMLPAFIATRLLRSIPSFFLVLRLLAYDHPLMQAVHLLRTLSQFAGLGLVLAALTLLHRHGGDEAGTAESQPVATGSQNDVWVGALWLGGGLLVTLASLALAPGGHVVVTTGAIAYGLVRLLRGLKGS